MQPSPLALKQGQWQVTAAGDDELARPFPLQLGVQAKANCQPELRDRGRGKERQSPAVSGADGGCAEQDRRSRHQRLPPEVASQFVAASKGMIRTKKLGR